MNETIRRITDQEICQVMGWQYGYHDTDITGSLLKRIRELEKVIRKDEVIATARQFKKLRRQIEQLANIVLDEYPDSDDRYAIAKAILAQED